MIRRTNRRMALCLTLLCLTLAFIWGNSLLPGETSSALSQWVKELIGRLFSLPSSDPQQGSGLLRKLAHFSEFALLGMVLSWLLGMLTHIQKKQIALTVFLGCIAACTDETIQRFVPGRHSSLIDVGIDISGVITGMILFYTGYLIYQKTHHHMEEPI